MTLPFQEEQSAQRRERSQIENVYDTTAFMSRACEVRAVRAPERGRLRPRPAAPRRRAAGVRTQRRPNSDDDGNDDGIFTRFLFYQMQ